jgi:hypothetical protein
VHSKSACSFYLDSYSDKHQPIFLTACTACTVCLVTMVSAMFLQISRAPCGWPAVLDIALMPSTPENMHQMRLEASPTCYGAKKQAIRIHPKMRVETRVCASLQAHWQHLPTLNASQHHCCVSPGSIAAAG